jgi:hypothetical protein
MGHCVKKQNCQKKKGKPNVPAKNVRLKQVLITELSIKKKYFANRGSNSQRDSLSKRQSAIWKKFQRKKERKIKKTVILVEEQTAARKSLKIFKK